MMADARIPRCHFWVGLKLIVVLVHLIGDVRCNQYKVGDLDGWNIPSSANPNVYLKWSHNHTFYLGDSLLFLYPPSKDSVLLVREESYQSCNVQYPILSMNDGNSVFNITCSGDLYFISGVRGHCESLQKLQVSVGGNGSNCSFPPIPSYAPSPQPLPSPSQGSPSPAPAPLGKIPLQETSSSSSPALVIHASPVSILLLAAIGLFIYA